MTNPMPDTNPETAPAPPPPAPAPPVPAAPAAPPQAEQPPPMRGNTQENPFSVQAAFNAINDTLSTLPEKLVDAAREATPPAPVVNTPPAQETAKRKSFGEWWFGN